MPRAWRVPISLLDPGIVDETGVPEVDLHLVALRRLYADGHVLKDAGLSYMLLDRYLSLREGIHHEPYLPANRALFSSIWGVPQGVKETVPDILIPGTVLRIHQGYCKMGK